MIHAKTSYFPAWNKRFYFLYFIDSSDSFHPFRRNFDRSFIFTTDNIPLFFQVQLGSRCHQVESAYPTIKVTQVFPSSPCLGILFSLCKCDFETRHAAYSFRPHVWGFFFHEAFACGNIPTETDVFVPMFGDPFFTRFLLLRSCRRARFRPHVWGSFFHSRPGMPHGMGSLWPFCGGDFQLIGILIIFAL